MEDYQTVKRIKLLEIYYITEVKLLPAMKTKSKRDKN